MRQSGILLHVTSLSSEEGIGTLGQKAYEFVDFLVASGMRIWQMLPITPTGYGDSPYQSMSTFAGNPLMIDIRMLINEQILYTDNFSTGFVNDEKVNYENVAKEKRSYLQIAFEQSYAKLKDEVDNFRNGNTWIENYSLFAAIKEYFGNISWYGWPDTEIRMRVADTLTEYKEKLKEQVNYHAFVQYLFFRQWYKLKKYANEHGVLLFGDMPIYVAEDSADVWANPEIFLLDKNRIPKKIAGVPPDYFSEDGQLWGNPIFNWKKLNEEGYGWWVSRLRTAGKTYDMLRIDHFIGFANYYAIPAGAKTARNGKWEIGPGRKLFNTIRHLLPDLYIVAEDLGAINDRVRQLLDYCGYPGMKVLTFAFDGDAKNPHLPQNHIRNCIVYTGTHDNDTILGWWETASKSTHENAIKALGTISRDNVCQKMISAVLESIADTAILSMQDILELPGSSRMNMPGTVGGNWLWRMNKNALSQKCSYRLLMLNKKHNRDR